MSNFQVYSVRVVSSGRYSVEKKIENLSWSEAVDRFLFYVHLALELDVSVRCCNIIKGKKKVVKTFINHSF